MTAIPNIAVQLVHIQGPLKGEIQELNEPEIVIGRHPDCQVQFPKDEVTLSRRHARIIREGNRFKIIDQSTNGTYVNGLRVPEAYLKDGDVITFSEGGPKVSFLTQVNDQQPVPQQTAKPVPAQHPAPPMAEPRTVAATPPPRPQVQPVAPPPRPAAPVAPPSTTSAPISPSAVPVESIKMPFAIQYGPALKSFQTLPITLGKGANCDFTVNHPAMNDQQVQVFFYQNQYWIKDLTGTQAVSINGMPIATQAPLQPNMELALSPQGPKFRFLGGGRLAEIEDPLPQSPEPAPEADKPQPRTTKTPNSDGQKKAGSLFKKFFS